MSAEFEVKQLSVGGFDNNFSYLIVSSNGEAALVDPVGDLDVILDAVAEHPFLEPKYVLLTHGHKDHIELANKVQEFFPSKIYAHSNKVLKSANGLVDGQKLPLGDGFVHAIFTPGHTDDCVCYGLSDNTGVFTGDTLFIDDCGYCKKDLTQMHASLMKIRNLPESNIIYSGHDYGKVPFMTLEDAVKSNPYLVDSFEKFRKIMEEL